MKRKTTPAKINLKKKVAKKINLEEKEIFEAKTRKEWREWLEENSSTKKEVWVLFYKKESKKESIQYEDYLEVNIFN